MAKFRDLILVGQDLCTSLINKLISTYLNDNTSIDSISLKLREICPKLYRNEDAACTKANEMIQAAKMQKNADEREKLLRNALKLCKDVAPRFNLAGLCRQFANCQFYEGVLELVVECANRLDPKDIAIDFYKNDQPPDDTIGYQAYAQRMDCYKEVNNLLDQLQQQSQASGFAPSLPATPGAPPPPQSAIPPLTNADAARHVQSLLQRCLRIKDELLHVAIYEWLSGQGQYSTLISLGQPSLEMFLKRTTLELQPQLRDILWQYHERAGNHAAAAHLLFKLATYKGDSVKLSERLCYLSKAVMCMRSDEVGAAPALGIFLHELEDLVLIARTQKQVLDAVSDLIGHHPQALDAVAKLNSRLYNITELYEDFAEPFELWESKLACIDCSGHDDLTLIKDVWMNIIDKEVAKCVSLPSDDAMSLLMSKIRCLGLQFGIMSRCFPLAFIVWKTELVCCQLKASRDHVHTTLTMMEVDIRLLLEAYYQLYSMNDKCWSSAGNELYLIEVIASFAENFVNNPFTCGAERRMIAVQFQDLITASLNILYSKQNTEQLISQLKGVLQNLNRVK